MNLLPSAELKCYNKDEYTPQQRTTIEEAGITPANIKDFCTYIFLPHKQPLRDKNMFTHISLQISHTLIIGRSFAVFSREEILSSQVHFKHVTCMVKFSILNESTAPAQLSNFRDASFKTIPCTRMFRTQVLL